MNLRGKRVLVFGGGGFIGSYLVRALIDIGCDVKVLLHYNSMSSLGLLDADIVDDVEKIFGDVRQLDTVQGAVCGGIDVVFNLAALIGIPYSYEHPQEVFEVNTMGTMNIMLASQNARVKKVIQTSTSEVYGSAIYTPINELHPLQPQSPYSASKIASDAIAQSFYNSYGFPVVIIRPFNTFGAKQSMRAVIPTIISQALFSNEIKIGSLFPCRDFTYVTDTVNGFIKGAEEGRDGEVYNIGYGQTVSIGDIVTRVLKLVEKPKMKVKTSNDRVRPKLSEVKLLFADNTKAKKELGWNPVVNFDMGLQKTISYIESENIRYNHGGYVK